MRTRLFFWIEFGLGAAGALLLGVYACFALDGFAHSRVAVEEFNAAISRPSSAGETAGPAGNSLPVAETGPADFSLWSARRLAAFEASWNINSDPAIAILRVPKIHLEVPVFGNTGDQSLNRGAGWIAGTTTPGQYGNVAIAGHRDGFFRKLKYVARGDEMVLQTKEVTEIFRVDRIEIVRPEETSVLQPRAGRSLTLVTCYPFYYVGRAPQRFVVEGHLESEVRTVKYTEVAPKTGLESNKEMFQGGTHK